MTTSGIKSEAPGSGGTHAPTGRVASLAEDVIAVIFCACLVGGVLADVWAHVNIIDTLEGFFTPWHGLLYGGFAATAAWTFWLAYRRRDQAPRWWLAGWPAGYALGGLGVLVFLTGGVGDMFWHETFGVEAGLDAAMSPSHMLISAGAVLLLSSPMRSWWAAGEGGWRTVTGIASMALATTMATVLLGHTSVIQSPLAPTLAYTSDPGGADQDIAEVGVSRYLFTTVLLLIPLLLSLRRRTAPGAAALVGTVSLFTLVMFEFRPTLLASVLGATLGALLVDLILLRLDATRGVAAPLRLPIAGALFAALVWSGHLLGLHLAEGIRWSPELWVGVVVLTSVLGALLGTLAARSRTPA